MPSFREALRAAAPQPAAPLDPEEVWRNALRRRRSRVVMAVCSITVVAAGVSFFMASESGRSLFDHGPVQPGDERSEADKGEERESARPRGTVVLASLDQSQGTNVTVIDLATGASRRALLPGFAPGDAQFKLIRSANQLVFRCSSGVCALDDDFEGEPRTLGDAWCFAPSATEGRAWLATLDPQSPETVRAMTSVREVSLDGQEIVDSELPSDRWHCPIGAVTRGPLFQEGDRLVVWDAAAEQIAMTLDGPFAAATHGDLVAWCDYRCDGGLHVTDVDRGEEFVVDAEPGFRFAETYGGAFSPDGELLAVPVTDRGGSRIAVVDIADGSVQVIPSSRLTDYRLMAWTASGGWLVFEWHDGALSAFRPRTGEEITIPLDARQTSFAIVTTSG